ncbi:MAG: hypothetical protein HDR00_09650 [Lachnospiraceae bacterium]|nr:hypothetical protein [Lachnospiraceae bacterium]
MSRQETEAIIAEYVKEMQENLNLRLLCETEQDISLWETVLWPPKLLWVEEAVLTGITYPEEKKDGRGSRFKGIMEWFRRIIKYVSKIF